MRSSMGSFPNRRVPSATWQVTTGGLQLSPTMKTGGKQERRWQGPGQILDEIHLLAHDGGVDGDAVLHLDQLLEDRAVACRKIIIISVT